MDIVRLWPLMILGVVGSILFSICFHYAIAKPWNQSLDAWRKDLEREKADFKRRKAKFEQRKKDCR